MTITISWWRTGGNWRPGVPREAPHAMELNRAWNSSRKQGFSRKLKSKISEKRYFPWKKIDKHTFFSMKIKMMDLWIQIEGTELMFIVNFSVLCAFRMPQIVQSLVSTFRVVRRGYPLEISSFFFMSNSRIWLKKMSNVTAQQFQESETQTWSRALLSVWESGHDNSYTICCPMNMLKVLDYQLDNVVATG